MNKESFDRLCVDVYDWSREQFGEEQPPEFPLIGVAEELGELTTSILKQAQGIDDSEKYEDSVGYDAEVDALADIMIYFADFVARVGAESKEQSVPNEDIDQLLFTIGILGDICLRMRRDRNYKERELERFVGAIEVLADQRGVNIDRAVTETWREVSDREWDSEIQQ